MVDHDSYRAGILTRYVTSQWQPPRPTQPPIFCGREMNTGRTLVMLCGRK